MRGFGSDNHSGVHPLILKKMIESNSEHEPSYGTDRFSEQAIECFRKHFGAKIDVHFVYNGTAANVLCLRAAIKDYESFFCANTSHLNVDECGAPEYFSGKLIALPAKNGKIILSDIETNLIRKGDQHYSQTRLISLTQPTELGTCYTIEEMHEITDFAHKNNLYVHIDGARLTNALVSLNTTYKEMVTDLGIDIVSFGGTKNGLAFGEAVLILNEELKKDFKYLRKQSAQLPSKTRFIASQFLGYFENDLHLAIAKNSVAMAKLLEQKLQALTEASGDLSQIKITQPCESNAVFVQIPQTLIKKLREKYFFYVWDEKTFECRLMTSWDTTKDDIEGFIDLVKSLQT